MMRPVLAPALLGLLLCSCSDTSLLFLVQDSASGAAVWDLTARVQDRELRSFYQTDAGPIPQRLSHLVPGKAILEVTAPGYQALSIPLTLRPGRNRLAAAIRLPGEEIPGLAAFSAFESVKDGDITVQLRALDASGKAIVHHPCLDLWIGCVVSEEMAGGVPVTAEGSAAAVRGAVLFRGVVPWEWDARPEAIFRYSARIPASDLRDVASLYRVIDYLVIVPDPARLPRAEVDSVMAGAWSSAALASNVPRVSPQRLVPALAAAVAAWGGRARAFLLTSWDVRARQS